MMQITLFHHVLGRTAAIEQLAERIGSFGASVDVPDLFEGQTFSSLQQGLSYVESCGLEALIERAEAACPADDQPRVFAGCSLGVMIAQHLLQTRPAAGGLFLYSFIDPDQLPGTWPDDVPVHLFGMEADEFLVDDGDLAAAQSWQQSHDNLHIHLYPGDGHLFAEEGFADYDAAVTEAMLADVRAALATMNPQS